MRPWVKSLWAAVRYCADCVGLLLCWALWIVLGGLLAAQIGIALSREFAVPKFVLRSIEARFTASDVKARFGHATFDPTGGVLIKDVSLSLPEFSEPVINAGAVFVKLDPWLLLAGILEVRGVRATDITLSVPAMLAPSGRNEALLSELDFAVTPGPEALNIEQLTARIAGVAVHLHGGFHPIATRTAGPIAPLPLIANLANNYSYFCRQLIRAAEELAAFDQPQLHAWLTPSPEHGAFASATLTARGMKFPRFHEIEAEELRAAIRIPLLGDATADTLLTFSAEQLRARDGVVAHGVTARVHGQLNPAHFFFVPKEIQITADDIGARGFSIESVDSNVRSTETSVWTGELLASAAGSRLSLIGEADFARKTAVLNVQGSFAPALLDPIGRQLGHDVRHFVDFGEPVLIDLAANFKAGWQFDRVAGHIAARQIDAYRVLIDSASG
ncbi:MAG TPA: hypothetical protein VL069_00595, partial [Opitutus sp.]|nr:hypothetical protein [Opitutus sp.]